MNASTGASRFTRPTMASAVPRYRRLGTTRCQAAWPAAMVAMAAAVTVLAPVHAQAPRDPVGAGRESSLLTASTRHLDLAGQASSDTVSPGESLSLRIAVSPKPGFYVYAPGATDYRVIQVRIEASPLLRVHEPTYPESTMHFFEPFKEWVPVYRTPFELVQDITIGPTPRARAQLAKSRTVTIRGTVEYQACDARVCYLPASIPFEWQVRVRVASGQPGRGGATKEPASR